MHLRPGLSGAALWVGTVSSDETWWGQQGLDANEPDDLWMEGASYDAEAFATFDCTAETGELVCAE